jgi:hypothetical protein
LYNLVQAIQDPKRQADLSELKNETGNLIAANYNGDQNESFDEKISRIEQLTKTSYSDLGIRVTIALLTVFLVQIFFALHKYNQRLAVVLANKAEALELIGSEPNNRKLLSREMIKLMREPSPDFGAEVKTPLQEVSDVARKVKSKEAKA